MPHTLAPESWYTDLDTMRADDAVLQRVYGALRADLSPEARERTAHIHVYPSRRCSYTIAKERIFIRVRNEGDERFLPDCVIRHVLLHELAHTINLARGHGSGFRSAVHWLSRGGSVQSCGHRVPPGYNPCH